MGKRDCNMGKSDRSAWLSSNEMVEKISVHVRTNLPVKSLPLGSGGKPVACFSGKQFIDFLLESEFSTSKDKEEGVFKTREDVINFAKAMMSFRRFYCASFGKKKIKKKDGTIKHKTIVNRVNGGYQERLFADNDEPFVWTYELVTRTTMFCGLLLLGGVVMCLALPLWPSWLRDYIIWFLLFTKIGRPGIWLAVYLITCFTWHLEILPHLGDADILFEKRILTIVSLKKSGTASGIEDDEDDDGNVEEDSDDYDNADDDDDNTDDNADDDDDNGDDDDDNADDYGDDNAEDDDDIADDDDANADDDDDDDNADDDDDNDDDDDDDDDNADDDDDNADDDDVDADDDNDDDNADDDDDDDDADTDDDDDDKKER